MNANLHNLDDSLDSPEPTRNLDTDDWIRQFEEMEEERILAEIYVDPLDLQMLDAEID